MPDLKRAFELGAEEIRIRVSRYGDDGKPACFQVWIDHQNRHVARSVGILANPEAAFKRAVEVFEKKVNPPEIDDEIEDLLA